MVPGALWSVGILLSGFSVKREHPGCADWGDVLMTMFFEMTKEGTEAVRKNPGDGGSRR